MDIKYVIAVFVGLLGYSAYQTITKRGAKGLLENLDTKNALNDKDKDIAKNTGLLQAEEEKRKDNEKTPDDVSNDQLRDFFNKK